MSNDASDGSYRGPYDGPGMQDTQRFGHPGGPQLGPGYPTMPPPSPPSWLPADSVQPKQPKQPKRGRGRLVAGAVALVLVAGGVGGGVGSALNDGSSSSKGASPTASGAAPTTTLGAPAQTISAPSGTPKSYAEIAAAVLPVVVSIDVRAGQSGDTGSGVIISADGNILTNNHVVAAANGVSGASITVHFNDGTSAPATIKGTDLSSDLAVIKVTKSGLPVAHLGTSAGVKVGDAVLAVGSPLGLSGTVTSGIVSALNRPVDTTSEQQQQSPPTNPFDPFGDGSGSSSSPNGSAPTSARTATVFGAIQTDAAINPGNSGGALVDAAGNVIGINSAIASLGSNGTTQSGNIGVGFAIPIDLAKYIANQLIAKGKASHAQIGVSVEDTVNRSTGTTTVVVKTVNPGSPGEKAGLKVGDVITKIDTTFATDSDTLIATIRSHLPGDTVSVTYTRAGTAHTAKVTLGSS